MMASQKSDYLSSLQSFCKAVDHADDQVSIYTNNYLCGHTRALENSFPVVRSIAGKAVFSVLAQVYVQQYPAANWDINVYGEQFSDLLAMQTKSAKAREYDWLSLARLARVEHLICQLYYADQDTSYSLAMAPEATGYAESIAAIPHYHPYVTVSQPFCLYREIHLWRNTGRIMIQQQCSPDATVGWIS